MFVPEGVQLLCLIDKQQDACRYLQTYGEWHRSVWLAKATLQEKEAADVFSKWAEHLAAVGVNQKVVCVCVQANMILSCFLFRTKLCWCSPLSDISIRSWRHCSGACVCACVRMIEDFPLY